MSTTCEACSTRLPRGARFCPACGVDQIGGIELLDLDDSGPATATVIETGTRRRGAWILAGTVATVLGVAAWAGGSGDGDADLTSDTTSTSDGSNTSTTRAPTTSRRVPVATTSRSTAPTTSILGPILPEPTGLRLVMPSQNSRGLTVIELDTGQVTSLGSDLTDVWGLTVDGDDVLVSSERGVQAVSLGDGSTTDLCSSPAGCQLVSNARWLLEYIPVGDGQQGEQWLRHLDDPGRVVAVLPDFVGVVGGLGDDLVANGPDRASVVRPDGTIELLVHGEVTTAGGGGFAWRECDDQLRCGTFVTDAAGTTTKVDDIAWITSISPDGTKVTSWEYPANESGHLVITALTTGARTEVEASESCCMAWSPDSRWLVMANGPVVVIDTETGTAWPVPGLVSIYVAALIP